MKRQAIEIKPNVVALRASCACTSTPIIRAGIVACASCGAPVLAPAATPEYFTQRNLPPGAGKAKFLRTHRKAREAGDPGAFSEGRARCLTADAWTRWARTEIPAPPLSAPRAVADDDVLAELGATKRGAA